MKGGAHQRLRVMLATPYGEDGMGGIDRLNDAIIRGFIRDPHGVICRRLVTRGKGNLITAQGVFAAALAGFLAAAARGEVDLLHIHLSVRGSSYRKSVLAKSARALGVPYVVHLHGTDYREFCDAAPAWLRREIGRMLTGSAAIIVLGEFWARVVGEIEPAAAHKITILPNATEPAPPAGHKLMEDAVRISFLGQLGHRKGSGDLLQALARMKHVQGWSATLAGDGAIAETRQQVQELGLSNVAVPGWMSTAQREALLAETDLLVLPSYAENLPMVILEAFAHGIPVITTPVGAIPEVVEPGRNGLLVDPGHVAGLAEAIAQLIDDPSLRRQMGDAARQDHAAKYEMGRYLAELASIWRTAHAQRRQKLEDLRASL